MTLEGGRQKLGIQERAQKSATVFFRFVYFWLVLKIKKKQNRTKTTIENLLWIELEISVPYMKKYTHCLCAYTDCCLQCSVSIFFALRSHSFAPPQLLAWALLLHLWKYFLLLPLCFAASTEIESSTKNKRQFHKNILQWKKTTLPVYTCFFYFSTFAAGSRLRQQQEQKKLNLFKGNRFYFILNLYLYVYSIRTHTQNIL